jgi:peptidoglycan hydrolase-like protein with peptidoglycan-binding domain
MRLAAVTIALLCAALTASAATPAKRKSTHHVTTRRVAAHNTSHLKSTKRGRTAAARPVVAMDTERATQIQTALIKSGYLSGEATGSWDAQSIAAMQKLQSDNGWQTKIVPDSRALIKLGLGPQSTHN